MGSHALGKFEEKVIGIIYFQYNIKDNRFH